MTFTTFITSSFSRNSETFCQNCKNELPDDFNVILPSPIYFYDFLAECPSPWLHYGYCTPCLVVARFTNNTSITEHIARCPALLNQCWDGEHEDLISEYKEKEAELADSGLKAPNLSINWLPVNPPPILPHPAIYIVHARHKFLILSNMRSIKPDTRYTLHHSTLLHSGHTL